MSKRAIAKSLEAQLNEAKRLFAEGEELHDEIITKLDASLERAWKIGCILNVLKDKVGHGNWTVYLEANWPALPARTATRYQKLDTENPGAKSIADLSPDSVRAFRFGYVPAKERQELEGDTKVEPVTHHLTILNDFNKFSRRLETGHAKLDQDAAKKDLRPVFEWLCGLYGVPAPQLCDS
jgi:hypothetical protein